MISNENVHHVMNLEQALDNMINIIENEELDLGKHGLSTLSKESIGKYKKSFDGFKVGVHMAHFWIISFLAAINDIERIKP